MSEPRKEGLPHSVVLIDKLVEERHNGFSLPEEDISRTHDSIIKPSQRTRQSVISRAILS